MLSLAISCRDTPVFAGDNKNTDMDYILKESEISCANEGYAAHTTSIQEQTCMLTNKNEHIVQLNTLTLIILMRLARALERGDSELDSCSYRETSNNSSLTLSWQPPDAPLLPTST